MLTKNFKISVLKMLRENYKRTQINSLMKSRKTMQEQNEKFNKETNIKKNITHFGAEEYND